METTLRYPAYHLILHWNGNNLSLQLCSQPLNGNRFAIDRLGNLFPFPALLILSLPLFFLEMMTTLDVRMEVLVLVCSKLTPNLTLWSQTHVLIWRC
jgi:hypothetical protein